MLDSEKIAKICDGWDDGRPVDWRLVGRNELTEYCATIKTAIEKTVNNLFGINNYSCLINAEKIILLNKETFGRLGVLLWDKNCKDDLTKIEENKFNRELIDTMFNGFDGIPGNVDYNKCECFCLYSNVMATSYDGYIIINIDKTESKLGLHLLCHEIFHSLASPAVVENLRKEGGNMGDEATNEFIARLVSLENDLGCTTTVDMKLPSDEVHDETGCYGKLLKKENFRNKKPEIIKQEISAYLSIKI